MYCTMHWRCTQPLSCPYWCMCALWDLITHIACLHYPLTSFSIIRDAFRLYVIRGCNLTLDDPRGVAYLDLVMIIFIRGTIYMSQRNTPLCSFIFGISISQPLALWVGYGRIGFSHWAKTPIRYQVPHSISILYLYNMVIIMLSLKCLPYNN